MNILTDEQARRALENENDQSFVSADSGIIRVPVERWNLAQAAESQHWMERGRNATNDRNDEHYVGFDKYQAIQGLSFEHAIELGCGPFTNLRLIGNVCRIKRCTLLDPLIDSYLAHPHCSFTRHFLFLQEREGRSLPHRIWKRLTRRPMRYLHSVAVAETIASPIEQMPTNHQYDLVAVINVLEHCFDAERVFAKILSVMRKGAFLVFHDKYYEHAEVLKTVNVYYDAAHPLQVDRRLVARFLEENFADAYKLVKTHHYTWLDEEGSYDSIYYVGRKL